MRDRKTSFILVTVFLAYSSLSWADTAPFVVTNQNPFVSAHGLARDLGADLTQPGQLAWSVTYSVASNFEIEDDGPERITIDAESTRADLRLQWGVAPGWEVGLEVPYLRHAGGYLDSLIIDWHDWFSLPQNGRDLAPRDQLLISYSGPGDSLLFNDDVAGLGDVQLFVARQLGSGEASSTVLRGHVKLPTGDEDDLLGSGSTDAGLSLHHQRQLNDWLGLGAWLGATYLGDSKLFADRSSTLVAQGGVRTQIMLNDLVTLKVQWDVHSQVYEETRLRQLNEIAYLLSFGGTLRFNPSHALDIVVVENYPHPEISPDVAFQLNWRWTPEG